MPCIQDRQAHLLARRFGYGASATGGSLKTVITSFADSSFFDALTDGVSRYICFGPALDGQAWDAPRVLSGSGDDPNIYIGSN